MYEAVLPHKMYLSTLAVLRKPDTIGLIPRFSGLGLYETPVLNCQFSKRNILY